MGNSSSNHGNLDLTKTDYLSRIVPLSSGSLIQTTTYNKWIKSQKDIAGFTDFTDFTSAREARFRHGVITKPDLTNGRYLIPSFRSKTELLILEKQKWFVGRFKLPRISVPDVDDPHWNRQVRHNRNRKECSIVGFHNDIVVIQITTNRSCLSPQFYILDLSSKKVLGYFVIFYHCRRWYECYISPNKKRIFLRPDSFTRVVALPDNYILENVTLHSSVTNLKVDVIPPIFRAHVLTFNSLAGDDCIVMASGRDIEIRSVISWTVLRQTQNLDLPSSIQQIKSSPLGDFLAIRCVHPVHCKEYSVNVIAIVCFRKLEILLKVDVRGCYWPVSEVINLQVFPRFCPSESSVAIMKNCSYTRKISVYKLPVKRLNLQYLCRRVILHVVSYRELEKLPLPVKLIQYLQARYLM